MSKKQINLPIFLIAVLLVGAGAFFAGMQYQKIQRGNVMFSAGNSRGDRMMGQRAGEQGGRMMQGFRPATGEIIAKEQNSITIKTEDGSSKLVMLGDRTNVSETKEASMSALTVGTKVMVMGEEKDGLITADMIQLNPRNMMIKRGETISQ